MVWFRQDLRLGDNPALVEAAQAGSVIPVYILDDVNAAEWAMGGASRWWLHHSLTALNQSLQGRLLLLKGDALTLLPALARQVHASQVVWNRCYEPWRVQRDKQLKEILQQQGTPARSFNGSLLWEPWQVLKEDQTPYKVFTPYFRRGCMKAAAPALPLPAPSRLDCIDIEALSAVNLLPFTGEAGINALNLLPHIAWDGGLQQRWRIGEQAAKQRLTRFLDNGIRGYKEGRNFPARENVSGLSPHLHFGEISPRQIWHEALSAGLSGGFENDLDCFQSELGWREFSYALLYHNPSLPRRAIQSRFEHFPWLKRPPALRAWQGGETGIPLVDAGMRELWQTGYMHNRVRMVVGSFLVKNLLTHWHDGEDWFWDCLVDADLASNSASWQWIAGCGADAAPYFRVFNAVTQSEKFDEDGEYLRRYLPELAKLPNKYIHAPFLAPDHVLRAAGVSLDSNYPKPVVDLKLSREQALAAFKSLTPGLEA
ncbi:MAG: deoxyribodipyrimidine photo-lyase [Pseudohongiella sp.]|nr:deoxyribodipyrimidine photo-lyase [Pseudohongiella sp.]